MVPDGFQVNTTWDGVVWKLSVEAELMGTGDALPCASLFSPEGEKLAESVMALTAGGAGVLFDGLDIRPWSCEDPVLYSLRLTLGDQVETMSVGFRQTELLQIAGSF